MDITQEQLTRAMEDIGPWKPDMRPGSPDHVYDYETGEYLGLRRGIAAAYVQQLWDLLSHIAPDSQGSRVEKK